MTDVPDGGTPRDGTYAPKMLDIPGFAHRVVEANGTELHYAEAGAGAPLLLMHGWPNTWYHWHEVMRGLAPNRRLIVPDLRGIGDSRVTDGGYDIRNQAADMLSLMRQAGFERFDVVGHDLGTPIGYMMAMMMPQAIGRLVVTDSVIQGLPGYDEKVRDDPYWWFQFHNLVGFAEDLVEGREGRYLDWFFDNLTLDGRGLPRESRDEFVRAYTGREALRGGFSHYRAYDVNREQGREACQDRLTVPTLAIGGTMTRDFLFRQLHPVSDDVRGAVIEQSGHYIPEEAPAALVEEIKSFVG